MLKRLLVALCYNILLLPGLLFACYKLYWPRQGRARFGARALEHFGLSTPVKDVDVWLHAVSVGEVIASESIIKELKARHPHWHIMLTTTTATGAQEASRRLANLVTHRYAPFDLLPCIGLFLALHRPRQLWIMETELWLNWLSFCQWRHIPVKLLNARLSTRSAARYQRFATFAHMLLGQLDWIGAQYTHDQANFIAAGASPSKVSVTGSIKYDLNLDWPQLDKARAQRAETWGARPTVIAISTHQGEDQLMLDIAAELREYQPELLLIIVPRHPERFDDVATLIARQASMARRSLQEPVTAKTQVYLADTMGELLSLLAMSDIAIMGGTFNEVGGHNYLEPAALGIPCVSGPHDFNFKEISDQLQQAKALVIHKTPQALGEQIQNWLSSPDALHNAQQGAKLTVANNQGATARTLAALLPNDSI